MDTLQHNMSLNGVSSFEPMRSATSAGLSARSYMNDQSSDSTKSCRSGDTSSSVSSATAKTPKPVETEFLIVGAGPAGASLACFLASHGKQDSALWSRVS